MFDTKSSSEKQPITMPEQQDSGTYIGLLLAGIILATGTIVLFNDLYSTFSTKGIDITLAIIFRMGLMLASAYGAISCFFALYRMAHLNRMLSKKIGGEFEDFVLYTRPFIEEVIRQRLAVEAVITKLETLEKRDIEKSTPQESQSLIASKWWEFLFFVALLTNISTGLYVYLEAHPYEMVPYSVIILGIAWWVLMAKYFGVLFDPKGIYIPAFFIAALPTLSILLRIVLAPYQALFIVFLVLFFYVASLYYYYKFLTTGIPPFSIAKLKEEMEAKMKPRAEKPTALEIEAKKESILEQALSRIKKPEPIQRQLPEPLIQTETRPTEAGVSKIVRSAIRARIQNLRGTLMRITWQLWLCQKWKKISLIGIFMMLLGVISIFTIPGIYEDFFLETFFIGVVIMIAGYSLRWKTGKKVFSWLTLPYLAGIVMSLGAIAVFFHFISATSLDEELQNIALTYIFGLLLIVLNIFIEKRAGKRKRIL